MIIYPESPAPCRPFTWATEFKTLITQKESGVEESRRQWAFQKRSANLKYDALSRSETDILWNFFTARQGSLSSFIFVEPDLPAYNSYTGEYVGRGDASQDLFAIPARSSSAVTVYVNGYSVSFTLLPYAGISGVEFASDAAVFTDGAAIWSEGGIDATDTDTVLLASPPGIGDLITVSFTGRLAIQCRFMQDRLEREMFEYHIYRMGIGIVERKKA